MLFRSPTDAEVNQFLRLEAQEMELDLQVAELVFSEFLNPSTSVFAALEQSEDLDLIPSTNPVTCLLYTSRCV